MDLQKAYQVFELDEQVFQMEKKDALETIEKKYELLLKRFKNKELNQMPEEVSISDINEAYALLKETISPPEVLPEPEGVQKGIAWFSNFIYHYKFQVIAAGIALIILYNIIGIFLNPRIDLNISFVGEFSGAELKLQEGIKRELKSLNRPVVTVFPFGEKVQGSEKYFIAVKTLYMAKGVDLYIFDQAKFDDYVGNGGFVNLDGLSKELSIPKRLQKIKTNAQGEHIYGIDVTECPLIRESGVYIGATAIAAVREDSDYNRNAMELLRVLAKQSISR